MRALKTLLKLERWAKTMDPARQPRFYFCFTEKVVPEILMIPLRETPLRLGATENVSFPFPMPPLSDVIVIHPTLLVAFQMHSSLVTTVVPPVPPAVGKL